MEDDENQEEEKGEMLQKDLNNIAKWSHKWEMEFNINKCKVMNLVKEEIEEHRVTVWATHSWVKQSKKRILEL